MNRIHEQRADAWTDVPTGGPAWVCWLHPGAGFVAAPLVRWRVRGEGCMPVAWVVDRPVELRPGSLWFHVVTGTGPTPSAAYAALLAAMAAAIARWERLTAS